MSDAEAQSMLISEIIGGIMSAICSILFICLIVFIVRKLIKGKKNKKSMATASSAVVAAHLMEKNKTSSNKMFAHYQPDVQKPYIKNRTEQEKYIVENYFIVENHKNRWLLLAGILAAILGIVFAAFIPVLGIVVILGAVVCFILFALLTKKHHQLTDAEYEAKVTEKIKEMNVEKRGLDLLGLDKDQIKEIQPFRIANRTFNDKSLVRIDEELGYYHSSTQSVMYLYFTNHQLFMYRLVFDMCCGLVSEDVNEIFYKDICDIRANTHNYYEEIKENKEKQKKKKKPNIFKRIAYFFMNKKFEEEDNKIEIVGNIFEVISLNSSVAFAFEGVSNSDDNNTSLASAQAMRNKIREVRTK